MRSTRKDKPEVTEWVKRSEYGAPLTPVDLEGASLDQDTIGRTIDDRAATDHTIDDRTSWDDTAPRWVDPDLTDPVPASMRRTAVERDGATAWEQVRGPARDDARATPHAPPPNARPGAAPPKRSPPRHDEVGYPSAYDRPFDMDNAEVTANFIGEGPPALGDASHALRTPHAFPSSPPTLSDEETLIGRIAEPFCTQRVYTEPVNAKPVNAKPVNAKPVNAKQDYTERTVGRYLQPEAAFPEDTNSAEFTISAFLEEDSAEHTISGLLEPVTLQPALADPRYADNPLDEETIGGAMIRLDDATIGVHLVPEIVPAAKPLPPKVPKKTTKKPQSLADRAPRPSAVASQAGLPIAKAKPARREQVARDHAPPIPARDVKGRDLPPRAPRQEPRQPAPPEPNLDATSPLVALSWGVALGALAVAGVTTIIVIGLLVSIR